MPLKRLTQSSALSTQHSTSPNGEAFQLPKPEDYEKEFKRLKTLAAKHRKQGREIVVVMGVGFVGAVMAGVIADSVQKPGINGDILGDREASHKVSPFIPKINLTFDSNLISLCAMFTK